MVPEKTTLVLRWVQSKSVSFARYHYHKTKKSHQPNWDMTLAVRVHYKYKTTATAYWMQGSHKQNCMSLVH